MRRWFPDVNWNEHELKQAAKGAEGFINLFYELGCSWDEEE